MLCIWHVYICCLMSASMRMLMTNIIHMQDTQHVAEAAVYTNVFCWVVFMIHYAWYLFVPLLTERCYKRMIGVWHCCCGKLILSLRHYVYLMREIIVDKLGGEEETFLLIVRCAEWDATAAKQTHFICLTIVLFPDSPAPGRDGEGKEVNWRA